MSTSSPKTALLDSSSLATFIQAQQIEAELIFLHEETPTVIAAADVLRVRPEQIIKSVLFLVDRSPVLVVANGLSRIDQKALADYLGMSRRRTKVASAEKVLAHTGYVAGSVPPFGHIQPLRTIVETAVTQQADSPIYGGGGDINALMMLTVSELQRVVGKEVVTLLAS